MELNRKLRVPRWLSAHVSCTATAVVLFRLAPPFPAPLPPSHSCAHTMQSRALSAALRSSRQHVHIVCSTRSEAKGQWRWQVEKSDSIFLPLLHSPPPRSASVLPISPISIPPLFFYCTLAIALTKAFRAKEKKAREAKRYGGMFSGPLGGRISECQNNFEGLWPVLRD